MCLGVPLVPLRVPRLDLVDECGLGRDAAPKALTTQMAEFDLSHIEPTAVFWGRVHRSFIRYSFRLRRIKRFIKRRFDMVIEIVHHQAYFFYMGIMLVNKFWYNALLTAFRKMDIRFTPWEEFRISKCPWMLLFRVGVSF